MELFAISTEEPCLSVGASRPADPHGSRGDPGLGLLRAPRAARWPDCPSNLPAVDARCVALDALAVLSGPAAGAGTTREAAGTSPSAATAVGGVRYAASRRRVGARGPWRASDARPRVLLPAATVKKLAGTPTATRSTRVVY